MGDPMLLTLTLRVRLVTCIGLFPLRRGVATGLRLLVTFILMTRSVVFLVAPFSPFCLCRRLGTDFLPRIISVRFRVASSSGGDLMILVVALFAGLPLDLRNLWITVLSR